MGLRLALIVVAIAFPAARAGAQVGWSVTYVDGPIGAGGVGFADPTVVGLSTLGQLRRDSIAAATAYLGKVLDGRGTINLRFDASLSSGTGAQASFGPHQIFGTSAGSFQNGGMYQAARTNQHVFAGPDGSGVFNFGYGWNYAGQSASASNYDMVSVAIHELTHGLGFVSFLSATGSGLGGRTPGTPDIYSGLDRLLQQGNGTTGALFNTTLATSGFGAFLGPVGTLTGGNDPSTGLFFGGAYTREVLGSPAAMHAPGAFDPLSSASHVADAAALMNPTVALNTVRSLQNYEIAMLLDIGWNVYNWDGTDGNWGDGAANVNLSRWRSDLGIVTNGSQQFNTFANPAQAPVLPVYGQVTSNIVLNFGGSGSSGYTATHDLGTVRLVRLNLNSAATAANTITGGTLLFGQSSDGSSAVLAPKIVQMNSGAFAIHSAIQIPIGLTVEGGGTGNVTLGGTISGSGGLTKAGGFTLTLSGGAANTYMGATVVNAGTLVLGKSPGVNALAGEVTVNPGATLRLGAANQLPGTGIVRLSGGTFSTGSGAGFSDVVGSLSLTASSTIVLGTGVHELRFSGISGTPAGTLSVTGWTGVWSGPGDQGKIIFTGIGGTPNSTYEEFLNTVQFQNFAGGSIFLATAEPGAYELVPAPEPGTILGIAALALGGSAFVRRKLRNRAIALAA